MRTLHSIVARACIVLSICIVPTTGSTDSADISGWRTYCDKADCVTEQTVLDDSGDFLAAAQVLSLSDQSAIRFIVPERTLLGPGYQVDFGTAKGMQTVPFEHCADGWICRGLMPLL